MKALIRNNLYTNRLPIVSFIVLYLCLSTFSNLFAQQRFMFNRMSTDQGLKEKKVYCILQDKKGFMWYGTEQGLLKHNGYEFISFRNNPEDPNTISNDYILSICEDKDGYIWIGTYGGLNKLNPETEIFTHYHHDPNNIKSISNDYIWAIIEDSEGIIWLGTYGGLNSYDKKTDLFQCYKNNPEDENSLSNDYVWTLLEDNNGNIWVGTFYGLNHFNKKTKSITRFLHDPKNKYTLNNNDIRSLYQEKDGNLWIGTYGGLNHLDLKTNEVARYSHDPSDLNSLSDNSIRTIVSDKYGTLWIGTANGLNRMTGKNFFTRFYNDDRVKNSLSSNDILSLNEDKFGTLWIGTAKDINKFDPINDKFTHIFKNKEKETTISGNNIWAIYEDELKNIWIGTANGLNKIDYKTDAVTYFEANPYLPNKLSYEYILSITQDFEKNYWIGTYGGGLNKYNPESKTFQVFTNNPLDANSLSNDKVWTLFIDSDSILWVATYGGLNRYTPDKQSFERYIFNPDDKYSISNNYVLSICEDGEKNLWIGTDDGLNKFDKKTEKFERFKKSEILNSISNNTIWSVCNDSNYLWIGTHGGGLNCYNKKLNLFTYWDSNDGLASDIVYGVLKDKKGNIWMSSDKGLSKFSPIIENERIVDFKIRNYDISDGIQGMEYNGGAYFKSEEGKMFFGGTNGLNAFYPDSVKDNDIAPEVVITKLKIFNKELKTSNLNSKGAKVLKKEDEYFISKNISYMDEILLTYRENVLSIEFAALHYSLPQNNQYAYKLENFEDEWIYCLNKRYANYTNLDPGIYIFRVKAANCDGAWNNEGTSIVIKISPPFYKTWTFRGIVLLVILLAIIFYIRFRERKIKAQKRKLEEIVAKRTFEIIRQKEEIEDQRDEIQAHRDEIRLQNKNITDSIKYALKIQQAILPSEISFNNSLSNNFIFYLPKDIVSGDLYWLLEIDEAILLAVVDCTGHGVPGALMSIVANNLLNQAVNEHKLSKPSDILNYLSEGVNNTLLQNNNETNVKDGMDIALCAFSLDFSTMEFSGAYNPLYIVRNNNLIQYKADSQSIEVSHIYKAKPFTNHLIELQKEDMIYLFTDGFVDQFGGPNRKKFLKKRLRETFVKIHKLPLSEQKEELIQTFNKWRGKNEQIDDVLILGIRI